MPRISSLLLAVLVLVGAFGAVAWLAHGVSARPAQQRTVEADIFMSDSAQGDRVRNFVSGTNEVFAVVEYENAASDQFSIRMRDLSGLVVKDERTPAVDGDGRHAIRIGVLDFVSSYTDTLQGLMRAPVSPQSPGGISNTLGSLVFNCAERPDVPNPWPPPVPTPEPGRPTPTPTTGDDPYTQWLKPTLSLIDSGRLTMSEITRTTGAMLGLPDMAEGMAGAAAASHLGEANGALADAAAALAQVPALLQPPEDDVQPDPEAGCQLIQAAQTHVESAVESVDSAVEAIPDDVSDWGLPETTARYDDDRFVACEQYGTDLFVVSGGSTGSTPADSTQWTLGNAGEPMMIFASADQTDASSIGSLQLSYGEGSSQIFARSVTVPGVNHTAQIGAFVTDASCRPVDGVTMTFAMDPAGFGTLSQNEVMVQDGTATVGFEAGDDVPDQPDRPAPQRGRITVSGQIGEGPGEVTAQTQFNVTGPASQFRVVVFPRSINPLENERGGITVEVNDKNGNKVADGTSVTLRIEEGDPGLLAYEQISGRERELVIAGREVELVTRSGATVLPPPADPGIQRGQAVYLVPDGPDGGVTLLVEADGATGTSDRLENGSMEPQIFFRSYAQIVLPILMANAKSIPRPEPRPTPRQP